MPPTGTKKSVVANFLNSLGIEASEEESAKELHAKIKQLDASRINTLAAEEIAKEYGVQVQTHRHTDTLTSVFLLQIVRLPPYMCEYNPIESFWAWVKHRLEDRIRPTDKIVEIRDKCLQLFDEVPEAICRNFVAHCKRLEQVRGRKRKRNRGQIIKKCHCCLFVAGSRRKGGTASSSSGSAEPGTIRPRGGRRRAGRR